MAAQRKLEQTSEPGIYRRHRKGCARNGRCRCPYAVSWRICGRQHWQTFSTFELAREHKGKMASGTTTRQPHSSMLVASYYETWLPSYRGRTARGLEETTRREYEISFRRHILPLPIAGMRMRDISAPNVRDWLTQLERRGGSPTVIRKAKAALSVMLASAVEDGDIGVNPATGVRYVPSEQAKLRHPKRKRRALSTDDVQAILAAMPERWRAFFMLLVQTGLRASEALGLTWESVHLGESPHIMVADQIYRGKRKKLKTEASRACVPLSPTMAAWLAELRPLDATAGVPVFASAVGTPLNYNNVYHRVLRPALAEAGLDGEGIAFHAFRKACAARCSCTTARRSSRCRDGCATRS